MKIKNLTALIFVNFVNYPYSFLFIQRSDCSAAWLVPSSNLLLHQLRSLVVSVFANIWQAIVITIEEFIDLEQYFMYPQLELQPKHFDSALLNHQHRRNLWELPHLFVQAEARAAANIFPLDETSTIITIADFASFAAADVDPITTNTTIASQSHCSIVDVFTTRLGRSDYTP